MYLNALVQRYYIFRDFVEIFDAVIAPGPEFVGLGS